MSRNESARVVAGAPDEVLLDFNIVKCCRRHKICQGSRANGLREQMTNDLKKFIWEIDTSFAQDAEDWKH